MRLSRSLTMPGLISNTMDPPPPPPSPDPVLGFVVSSQKLEIEVDFTTQSISGRTEITILPLSQQLKQIRINARQCEVLERNGSDPVTVNGRTASFEHEDSYEKLNIRQYVGWSAEQWEMQKERIKPMLQTRAVPGELIIDIPKTVRLEEVNPFSESAPSAMRAVPRSSSSVFGSITTPTIMTPRSGEEANSLRYAPIKVVINFKTTHFRDGLHFVGVGEGLSKYPHVYTKHSTFPGTASCIFPCVDDPEMRCTWEIAITCARTLADAFRRPALTHKPAHSQGGRGEHGKDHSRSHGRPNGINSAQSSNLSRGDEALKFGPEGALLEMVVVCSAELLEEVADPDDPTKKIVKYLCSNQVAAQHIGFAVGPFEQVDLSEFREQEDDEKLGQKAVQVYGYCLPQRADEVRYTCEAMAPAVDWFSLTLGSYPFTDYKLCFVDCQIADTVPIASMSLCSSRLLMAEDIIDPAVENTRQLVHALASQWIGVTIIASSRVDTWVIVGLSYFIADLFMQTLCGRNEYRFNQKQRADRLVDLDIQRPSLYALGETLHLGAFELEFMSLKAPSVMFILDRRMMKFSGSTGLTRIIAKMVTTANTSEQLQDKTVSTESFRRLCEKIGHYKLDTFFNQWVLGAGCPRFQITQRFNKKKLVVEMTITQKQDTLPTQTRMDRQDFVREYKEDIGGVYAGEIQSAFTGPMTIRIHEADGTPYEHIVEIRESVQKIEIPYHTKYKRLKRSRREKERAHISIGGDVTAENEGDVLLYCLGDVLQSPEEVRDWSLIDWDADIEREMEQESYEWIRMDADFEWICHLSINMKPYMFVSQLQQDRDVVAQQDSMLFLGQQPPHPLISTFLVRTLMDRRYFHGIRTMAADYLSRQHDPKHEQYKWIGRMHLEKAFQEFFCYPGSSMPRSNNFSDQTAYLIKCAIPKAMSKVRDSNGKCPVEARTFILDQLRFNDNGTNPFADHHYIACLMQALADCMVETKSGQPGEISFNFEAEDNEELQKFRQTAVDEIDRYRRMDEWIQSYQNLYTVTALNCKQILMKEKVIPTNLDQFFPYIQAGTLDFIRIKAFDALNDLGLFTNSSFTKFLTRAMSNDPSPYVRDRLFQVFNFGLAAVAFGEDKEAESPPAPPEEGDLIIEQNVDANLDAKKALISRTTTIDGALSALKTELNGNDWLKESIWKAIQSRSLGITEQSDLLDICSFLYEPKERMLIVLRKPRYWKAVQGEKKVGSARNDTDSILTTTSIASTSRELTRSARSRFISEIHLRHRKNLPLLSQIQFSR